MRPFGRIWPVAVSIVTGPGRLPEDFFALRPGRWMPRIGRRAFFFAGPIPSIWLNPRLKQNPSAGRSIRRESSIAAAKGLYRGSALLGPSFLRSIAECAAAFERILGYPQDLGLGKGDAERPVIVNVSPARGLDGSDRNCGCDSGALLRRRRGDADRRRNGADGHSSRPGGSRLVKANWIGFPMAPWP